MYAPRITTLTMARVVLTGTRLTIVGSTARFLVVHHFVVEGEQIDGNGIFSGIVLLNTSEKRLGEEEAADP